MSKEKVKQKETETFSYREPARLPRVHVLLAACNGAEWIEEQILSILGQQHVWVEIYISIDSSTDGTLELCQTIADRHQTVKLLPMRSEQNGAAGNFFWLMRQVDLSSCDYVALADQDDLWFSEKLFRSCTTIFEQGVAAYSSNVIAFWPGGKKKLINKSHPQKPWDFLFEAAGPGCTYVLTQPLAQAFKDFLAVNWNHSKEFGYHDWLVYAFARSKGYTWFIDSKTTMLYRQHGKNVLGVNSGSDAIRNRFKLLDGGFAFEQIRNLCQLLQLDNLPFVRRWNTFDRSSFLFLSLVAVNCRRRLLDQLIMAVLCLYFAMAGVQIKKLPHSNPPL